MGSNSLKGNDQLHLDMVELNIKTVNKKELNKSCNSCFQCTNNAMRDSGQQSSIQDSLTSSDISVAIDRPISWNLFWLPIGPSNRNRKRVGTGTSVRSPRTWALVKRTNATIWWLRYSTSPTRIFAASAPGGIFFMKWRFWKIQISAKVIDILK